MELNALAADRADFLENHTFTAPSMVPPDFINQISDISDESDTTILRINRVEGCEEIDRNMFGIKD